MFASAATRTWYKSAVFSQKVFTSIQSISSLKWNIMLKNAEKHTHRHHITQKRKKLYRVLSRPSPRKRQKGMPRTSLFSCCARDDSTAVVGEGGVMLTFGRPHGFWIVPIMRICMEISWVKSVVESVDGYVITWKDDANIIANDSSSWWSKI